MARVVDTAARGASDAIVGRKAELDSLTQFAEAVRLGPTALMLNGEQGIGKTTLWKWGLRVAQERSFRVLSTRPSEAETQLPYAGLGDLLYHISDGELAVLPRTQRRALKVALLRAEAEGPPLEQRTISVGLLGALSHLSRSGPVLVAVDDVQWLDVPSQRVLRFALRRLDDQPIGVLISARTSNPDEDPFGLDRTFAVGRVGYLFVKPLDEPAVDELLHTRLATRFPRPIVQRVHLTSGGNPFYVLELGRALLRQGVPTALGERLPVPETLRELVLDRLFRLPGTVREVLLTVAALSRPTVAQVEQALGHRERTAAAIDRAVRAGVVECDNGDLRFTHPLFGSVLYGDASGEAKRKLHRNLAPVVPDMEERAQHLGLAAESPDAAVAAALDDAAKRARARGAPDAAAALAEHARRLTPANRPDDAHRRTREAASDHLEAGDTGRARQLLEELATEASDGPDRARALVALSRVLVYDEGHHAAERPLQHALDLAGDDPSLRAAIERDLVTAILQTSDLRRAEPHARKALEWAERAGDPALISGALAHLAMVEFLRGRGIRVDLMERALALEHQATGENPADARPVLPTNLVWGGLLKWADEFDAARERFEAVRQQAAARGAESTWVSLLFQHGELELWAGNWDLAARYAREAEAIAVRSLQPAMPDYVYLGAAVAAHFGQVEEARAAANAALSQAKRVGDLRFELRCEAILGFIELSLGEAHAAQPYLDRSAELYVGAGYCDPGVIRFLPDAVEALVAVGEPERAEPLLDDLEERGTTLNRPYAQATALRCRGLVLAASGNLSEAVSVFEQALGHHARLPQPFELGRTLLIHGVVQRRLKQKRLARASLRDALEIFDRLGARLWAERGRSELERVGGRPSMPAALTPTEGRVAELVTAGYTNREIADEMFLSVKTVEANLTRIYRKLGVRSRRELARRSKAGNLPDSESIPSP